MPSSETEPKETTDQDIHRIAIHLASKYQGVSQEDFFQEAFLAGLEARERGVKVYSAMRSRLSHMAATYGCPVEIPNSSLVNSAIAKSRQGIPPETATELRIASVIGFQEDVLPVTIITRDNPESLLIDKQLKQNLERFLDYDTFYLTSIQRDAIGVVFFGKPLPEDFMTTYGVGKQSIYWHSQQAVDKIKRSLKAND